MRVEKWMTQDLITVDAEDDAHDAWDKITSDEVRQLPVLSDGELVGVISRGDLLRAFQDSEVKVSESNRRVKEIMTPDPITVEPDLPFEEATDIISENKVGSLVVVEDGEVVGILTRSDLFRSIIEMTGLRNSGKREEYAGSHLGKCFRKLQEEPEGKYAKSFLAYREKQDGNWVCLIRFAEHNDD